MRVATGAESERLIMGCGGGRGAGRKMIKMASFYQRIEDARKK